jgi:hypothetical protein
VDEVQRRDMTQGNGRLIEFSSFRRTNMKYVALLSGGKDSCYNLLHCSHNGHELVAAASLGPENGKGPTALNGLSLT